jgi:hypothetical protein
MTDKEAFRAIGETIQDENDDNRQHLFELSERIVSKGDTYKEWSEDSESLYLDDLDEEVFQED